MFMLASSVIPDHIASLGYCDHGSRLRLMLKFIFLICPWCVGIGIKVGVKDDLTLLRVLPRIDPPFFTRWASAILWP